MTDLEKEVREVLRFIEPECIHLLQPGAVWDGPSKNWMIGAVRRLRRGLGECWCGRQSMYESGECVKHGVRFK